MNKILALAVLGVPLSARCDSTLNNFLKTRWPSSRLAMRFLVTKRSRLPKPLYDRVTKEMLGQIENEATTLKRNLDSAISQLANGRKARLKKWDVTFIEEPGQALYRQRFVGPEAMKGLVAVPDITFVERSDMRADIGPDWIGIDETPDWGTVVYPPTFGLSIPNLDALRPATADEFKYGKASAGTQPCTIPWRNGSPDSPVTYIPGFVRFGSFQGHTVITDLYGLDTKLPMCAYHFSDYRLVQGQPVAGAFQYLTYYYDDVKNKRTHIPDVEIDYKLMAWKSQASRPINAIVRSLINPQGAVVVTSSSGKESSGYISKSRALIDHFFPLDSKAIQKELASTTPHRRARRSRMIFRRILR